MIIVSFEMVGQAGFAHKSAQAVRMMALEFWRGRCRRAGGGGRVGGLRCGGGVCGWVLKRRRGGAGCRVVHDCSHGRGP